MEDQEKVNGGWGPEKKKRRKGPKKDTGGGQRKRNSTSNIGWLVTEKIQKKKYRKEYKTSQAIGKLFFGVKEGLGPHH